ncbi:MAG: hypothetical protein DRJ28_07875 [Actinobacteria bacterium]|nr:MAG: hypothetical protein DRJ28_07875 [Actinomycetota bacterium]
MVDRQVVTVQIGRPPRSPFDVRARCHLDLPIVIDVPPILDDGTPFPTTHWLTCRLALLRVSRIESQGGVAAADRLIAEDPDISRSFAEAMSRYQTDRDRLIPSEWGGPRPSGGVGGSRGGVKCLHAHYADTASGNENPIGAAVAIQIEPLDCTVPCVIPTGDGAASNEAWTEPT